MIVLHLYEAERLKPLKCSKISGRIVKEFKGDGGGVLGIWAGVLWLILHNDYKTGLIFKKVSIMKNYPY